MNYRIIHKDSLMHFGVPGMQWGMHNPSATGKIKASNIQGKYIPNLDTKEYRKELSREVLRQQNLKNIEDRHSARDRPRTSQMDPEIQIRIEQIKLKRRQRRQNNGRNV